MAATAGSRSAAVRNVPLTQPLPASGRRRAPSERGKNSYQEPNERPLAGRPAAGSGPSAVTRSRSGCRRSAASTSGAVRGGQPDAGAGARASRSAVDDVLQQGRGRPALGARSWRLARTAGRPPPSIELDVDAGRDLDLRVVPPGGHRVAPRLDVERPVALGGRGDLGGPAVGARRCPGPSAPSRRRATPLGPRSTTLASTASCPSRNTVALDRERLADAPPWPGNDRSRRRAARRRWGCVRSEAPRVRCHLPCGHPCGRGGVVPAWARHLAGCRSR